MARGQLGRPYLGGWVELTPERERHIAEHHPDLLPEHRALIAAALVEPTQVRRSARMSTARLFSRRFIAELAGKHVVVVVVSDPPRSRHRIVTAYIARRLAGGDSEWTRG